MALGKMKLLTKQATSSPNRNNGKIELANDISIVAGVQIPPRLPLLIKVRLDILLAGVFYIVSVHLL